MDVTLVAAQQVGRPIFFAMVIIILAFIRSFSLTGRKEIIPSARVHNNVAMAGSTVLGDNARARAVAPRSSADRSKPRKTTC